MPKKGSKIKSFILVFYKNKVRGMDEVCKLTFYFVSVFSKKKKFDPKSFFFKSTNIFPPQHFLVKYIFIQLASLKSIGFLYFFQSYNTHFINLFSFFFSRHI